VFQTITASVRNELALGGYRDDGDPGTIRTPLAGPA
jgi:hypothetical protein